MAQARYVVRTVGELLYWLSQTNPALPIATVDDHAVVIEILEDEGVIITDEVEE